MAWTDHFEHEGDAWYVTFPFAHICYVPLFPCGSAKLMKQGADSGFRIPCSCSTLMTNWAYSSPCCCFGLLTYDGPAASEAAKQPYTDIISGKKPRSLCPAESRCPNGHLLTVTQASHAGFVCDVCKRRVEQGATLYSCRACDYDVCQACQLQAENSSTSSGSDEASETSVSDTATPPAQVAPMPAATPPAQAASVSAATATAEVTTVPAAATHAVV